MFVIAVKKLRNPKYIERNAFEQTLFVNYSTQHNMVGVQLTTEQRTLTVAEYNSTGSPERVTERFEERFPDRQPPCTTRMILRNFAKYLTHGTSQN